MACHNLGTVDCCETASTLRASLFFFLMIRRPPRPPLFPPTTLFRSEPAQRVADRHVVAINPAYATEIIETPPYLANSTPSGAAFALDTLTDHSREIFLATTDERRDRKSTRLNSSHSQISYAVFCLKK